MLLINRVTQSVVCRHNACVTTCKLQNPNPVADKLALPFVAELRPAAVCKEQHGRAAVVQFDVRPCDFPQSDCRPGELASAAAAGKGGISYMTSLQELGFFLLF